jgi:hypothetical protein
MPHVQIKYEPASYMGCFYPEESVGKIIDHYLELSVQRNETVRAIVITPKQDGWNNPFAKNLMEMG